MKKRKPLFFALTPLLAFGMAGCTGCGPAPDVYTILPNQTGFLIPLRDTSAQAKFQSATYLTNHKVAAHQVQINYHSVSNNNNGATWYPNDLLVVVDRAAVTRQWTGTSGSGTSNTNQAFPVTSADGVQYYLEATCTGYASEGDAANYLFHFPSQSTASSTQNLDLLEVNSLPHVMDTNVWGRLDADVAHYFNGVTIREAYRQSASLFERAVNDTTTHFAAQGLTLTACGIQGGPRPVDPSIAQSFADTANRSNLQLKAEAQATAQAVTNQQDIAQAQARATQTSYGNQAQLNYLQKQGELLQRFPGLTAYTYASRSNGQGPQVVLGGASGVVPMYPLPVPATPTPGR